MNLDFERVQKLLKDFDFPTLFREELGWEPHRYDLNVSINGEMRLLYNGCIYENF